MTTYAFCLGVNQYTWPIPALRCAERDAIKLAALMGETLGFEAEVLEERTTSGIEKRIEALGQRLRPGDSFVFYFSGHGKAEGDDHLLLLPEARLHMLESGSTVTSGLLSWRSLCTLTAQAAWQGVQRVFVIDACRTKLVPIEKGNGELPAFDGHVLLRNVNFARKPRDRDQPPYTLLTACDHGEPAVELPDGSSSVFNAALMQDLRDARRTGAWRVDAAAAQRLHQRVEALRTEHKLTAPAYKQTPQWRGTVVELPLRRGEPPPPPPPPRPHPPPDEESAWATAHAADTVRAYERYLAEFPAGRYVARAQARLRLLRQEQQRAVEATARRLKAAGAVVALLVGAGLVWAFVQDTGHRGVGELVQTALVRSPLAGPELFKAAPSERDFSILDDKALLEKAQVESRWAELSAAAEGGDLNAAVLMAISTNEGLKPALKLFGPDYDHAAQLLRRAADKGHSRAMANLGVMLEEGWSTPFDFDTYHVDKTEALRWYRRAAEAGNAYGIYRLGEMLHLGKGVPQNDTEAYRWYRRAAEAGHSESMASLGAALEYGWGVQKNEPEAVRWYRSAAAAGNATGMSNLGLMLKDGRGVEKDETEAYRWFRRAVEAGGEHEEFAMFNLARMLEDGRGVDKSRSEAVRWYRRAAKIGHTGAKDALKRLGEGASGIEPAPVR
ncbi:MAG: caspase family protein [Betaproteobacteria bacterium]